MLLKQNLLVNVFGALRDVPHEHDYLGLGQLKVVRCHLLEQLAPAQQLRQDDLKCSISIKIRYIIKYDIII